MSIVSKKTKEGYVLTVTNETWIFTDRKKFQKARGILETYSDNHKLKYKDEEEIQ